MSAYTIRWHAGNPCYSYSCPECAKVAASPLYVLTLSGLLWDCLTLLPVAGRGKSVNTMHAVDVTVAVLLVVLSLCPVFFNLRFVGLYIS